MPLREMDTGGVQPASQGMGIAGFTAAAQGIAVEGMLAHREVGGAETAQKDPAAATQRTQAESAEAPTEVVYIPTPQDVQVVMEVAPVAADQVPKGHGVGFKEESGQ
jgi:hypothetical protein